MMISNLFNACAIRSEKRLYVVASSPHTPHYVCCVLAAASFFVCSSSIHSRILCWIINKWVRKSLVPPDSKSGVRLNNNSDPLFSLLFYMVRCCCCCDAMMLSWRVQTPKWSFSNSSPHHLFLSRSPIITRVYFIWPTATARVRSIRKSRWWSDEWSKFWTHRIARCDIIFPFKKPVSRFLFFSTEALSTTGGTIYQVFYTFVLCSIPSFSSSSFVVSLPRHLIAFPYVCLPSLIRFFFSSLVFFCAFFIIISNLFGPVCDDHGDHLFAASASKRRKRPESLKFIYWNFYSKKKRRVEQKRKIFMLLLLVTRSMCSASHLLKVFFRLVLCLFSRRVVSFSFRLGHHIIIPKHITDALALMLPQAHSTGKWKICCVVYMKITNKNNNRRKKSLPH